MKRMLLSVCLVALCGVGVGPAQVQAQDKSAPAAGAPSDVVERLAQIERDLKVLMQEIQELKKKLPAGSEFPTSKQLETLTDEIVKLRLELARRSPESRIETRQAFASPAAVQGSIQMINQWMLPVSVIVDGVAYTLRPGEARMISHAPGNFTYEVPGIRAATSRYLGAGETYTITIAPR